MSRPTKKEKIHVCQRNHSNAIGAQVPENKVINPDKLEAVCTTETVVGRANQSEPNRGLSHAGRDQRRFREERPAQSRRKRRKSGPEKLGGRLNRNSTRTTKDYI